MIGHSVTDNELMKILNKSGDSSSDNSLFSDNEIDDVAVVDAIIHYYSDEEEETLKKFLWKKLMIILDIKNFFCR